MAYHPIPGQSGSGSSPSPSSRLHYLNNSQFGDTTFTKVFVGGLAWETQSETMRHYFVQFGEILEAVVITDKNTGRSKGYGFVTFRDPEAARRACADPTPIIDGRRANCNLASLGRPRISLPLGRMRSPNPIIGNSRVTIGGFGYQQSVPFAYQQGYVYSLYGYSPYGPDYNYSQGLYNPYMNQQYLQLYGVPGTGSPSMYPNYGQLGHSSATVQGSALQGYTVPGHQIFQYSGGSSNASTISSIPSVQSPYHAGLVTSGPTQPQFIISAHSPQFMQGGSSDQASG